MDPTRTNPGTAANGEWQTAGKTKSTKPKQKPQPSPPIEANSANGHASGDAHANNYQNGSTYNGGGGYRRGGRQSSAGSYGGGGRSSQNSTPSSQYSRPTSSKEEALSKRKLLEKEAKNISKQDAAIERVGKSFNEEIDRSRDRLRHAFDEMRHQLMQRERLMLDELDRCKKEGTQLLNQQEQRAKELKDGAEHAGKLNDRQIDDLRSQIRRFVAERRFEEELGGTSRFRYDSDRLLDAVKNFGEIIAIGGGAGANGGGGDAQKHSSMSSLVSSGDGDGIGSGNKLVSEIALGGIMMKSDSMDADQLAELTRSLRENLKLQGIAEDILPEVCGASVIMPPPRRRPPSQTQRDERQNYGGRGGGFGGNANRNGGFQRR